MTFAWDHVIAQVEAEPSGEPYTQHLYERAL